MVSSTTLQARASSCFRPLTGIVLYDYQIKGFFKEVSPPYGDGIKWAMQNQTYSVFSPPYGDGISEKVTNVLTLAVFAPLRGLYQLLPRPSVSNVCFRPLAGIVP